MLNLLSSRDLQIYNAYYKLLVHGLFSFFCSFFSFCCQLCQEHLFVEIEAITISHYQLESSAGLQLRGRLTHTSEMLKSTINQFG